MVGPNTGKGIAPWVPDPIPLNGSTIPGRRYVLDSGDAIATYCPADGSVAGAPVSAGDRLYDGNTGDTWIARTVGATTDWMTPYLIPVPHGNSSSMSPAFSGLAASGLWYGGAAYPHIGTHVLYESVAVSAVAASGTHDATDNYEFKIPFIWGNAIGSLGTTEGLTTTKYLFRYTVNQIIAIPAAGADPDLYSRQWRFDITKNNAPSNITGYVGAAMIRLIAR